MLISFLSTWGRVKIRSAPSARTLFMHTYLLSMASKKQGFIQTSRTFKSLCGFFEGGLHASLCSREGCGAHPECSNRIHIIPAELC